MTEIKAEYSGLKPIKSRKIWVLEIEFAEERIDYITSILGFPRQGGNAWVTVALLNEEKIEEKINETIEEPPEGWLGFIAKIEALLRNRMFHKFICQELDASEYNANLKLHEFCEIESFSDLTRDQKAYDLYIDLRRRFSRWCVGKNFKYED